MSDKCEKDRTDPNKDNKNNSNSDAAPTTSNYSGGWLSWYSDAKAKTMSTLVMVKRDLSEFGETAVSTMDSIVGQAPQDFGTKAGQWIKNLASTVNETVLQMTDTTQDELASQIPVVVAQGPDKLANLQADPNTFLSEPPGVPELFEDWLDHFDLADKKAVIQDILANNAVMRKQFTELVPSRVQNHVFWKRYFYKVQQLEMEQAKIDNFVQKTESKESTDKKSSSDLDSWGDESDFDDITTVVDKCLGLDAKAISHVPEHLDESMATAVLEMEDNLNKMRQRDQSKLNNISDDAEKSINNSGESKDGARVSGGKSIKNSNQSEGGDERSVNNSSQSRDGARVLDKKSIIGNDTTPPATPTELMTSSATNSDASFFDENTSNNGRSCSIDNNDERSVVERGVTVETANDDEIKSENSFCVVKSIDSADNL